jgi:hypothetical protein
VPREIDLSKLSHAEKDAIILSLLPLVGQLEAALARIAELEARLALLERLAKTPDNASLPPSKGQKSDQPADGAKPPRRSRPGFGRALEPNPERIVDRLLDACPHCAAAWPAAPQAPQLVYDRIELPPIKPDVTRVRLFGGRCACCGERAIAAAPAGLEPGSPFGRSIEALVVYLHYAQAIGIERLRCVLAELFGLSISEGALCNILARAQAPLEAAASAIAVRVTAADVVASDETSVRVMKQTCWEWVFVTAACVLHIIRPSRGAAVVRGLFGARRPRVWVSDSLGSAAMPIYGRSVSPICWAMRNMPSTAVTRASRRHSSACCCAPSPSGGDAAICPTPLCASIAPIWTAGWTACWPCHDAGKPPRNSAGGWPATATIRSGSPPTATCQRPTMSPSAHCGQA